MILIYEAPTDPLPGIGHRGKREKPERDSQESGCRDTTPRDEPVSWYIGPNAA
jgi:hypothetical protein